MPQDSMPTLESRLRQMASQEQRRTATELASLVLPLAELGSLGLPPGGLGPIADAIRAQTSITSVDEARHALLSMPEMSRDEEPEGYLDWFAFGHSSPGFTRPMRTRPQPPTGSSTPSTACPNFWTRSTTISAIPSC